MLALAGATGRAEAADYFASPNASTSGNGSLGSPWRLDTALAQPAGVRPGDTIWLLGGTYKASISDGFNSTLNGTPSQPIIVRNYNGQRATIDGIGTQYALQVTGSYTWFWGIEVMDSQPTRIVNAPGPGVEPNAFGVAVYGPGNKFINMVVHDTAEGFSAYDASPNCEFSGNLSYYNGWVGSDRNHGHGFYLQNISGIKTVANNFVGDNFDEGMQIYGSGAAHVQGFMISGNTLYNTSSIPYPAYQYNLLIGGGSDRSGITLQHNYSFFTPSYDYGFVNLGQYTYGTDLTMINNVFVGGYTTVDVYGQYGPVIFTGNALYNRPSSVHQVSVEPPSGQSLQSYSWDGNRYYGLNSFYLNNNWQFSDWQRVTGFDAHSTFDPNAPGGTWVYLEPNQYESKRANITIFNWNLDAGVAVDLSNILSPGDNFIIQDAQNFYGSPVASGTYGGGSVTIPMINLPKAKPVGLAAPAHTAPLFGTFVVTAPGSSILPPPSDGISPAVALTAPTPGQTVSGTVSVSATASDNVGVVGVQFLLDGSNLGSEAAATPYAVSWDTTQVADGSHTLTAVARDAAGNRTTAAAVPVTVQNCASCFTPIRVRAGGAAYTDNLGHVWSADTGFSGGSTFSTGHSIAGTSAQALYQTERWSASAFQYQFAVPSGNYTVNLKFSENFATAAGQRVMNVNINGQAALTNFDIFAQAGAGFTAVDKATTVTVTTGQLTILFSPVIGAPKINAIEILGATGPPPAAPVSVTVNPSSVILSASQVQQFSATVSNAADTSVTWSLSAATPGADPGTLIVTGPAAAQYTAPSSITPSVSLIATSNADATKSAAAVITLQAAPVNPALAAIIAPIRVRAGGGGFTDHLGQVWVGDYGYNGGTPFAVSNAISGTADPFLYQGERWSISPLQYQFSVPNGTYTVTLKFSENYATAAGQRVFNVAINGQTALSSFDIFARAGGAYTAVDTGFATSVSNGQMIIEFIPVIGAAKIDAIQIVQNTPLPIRVNAGGPDYTDPLGQVWLADGGYTNGSVFTTSHSIDNTLAQPLYQNERWDLSSFAYQFFVANGTYHLNLKFSENYATAPGQRVFNVTVNGQPVLTNFDIFAQAGGNFRAVDEASTVTVTDGTLLIQFSSVSGAPKVDALEIY